MNESLDTYLRALESEDLLQKADALRSLQQHPGWAVLVELVGVQVEKEKGQLIARPLSRVQDYAHVGGHIAGLESFPKIIDKTLDVARRVTEALSDAPAGG